jgi:hypothetical protein
VLPAVGLGDGPAVARGQRHMSMTTARAGTVRSETCAVLRLERLHRREMGATAKERELAPPAVAEQVAVWHGLHTEVIRFVAPAAKSHAKGQGSPTSHPR